jgi:hypothetical protein
MTRSDYQMLGAVAVALLVAFVLNLRVTPLTTADTRWASSVSIGEETVAAINAYRATLWLHAARKRIDNDHFPILYHIVLVFVKECTCTDRGLEIVHIFDALLRIEIGDAKCLLCLRDAVIRELNRRNP